MTFGGLHCAHIFIDSDNIQVAVLDWNFFQAVGNFIFAFNCHLNVSPVAGELADPSSKRMRKITYTSILGCLGFYLVISICGYLSFAQDSLPDILDNYPERDYFAVVSRAALCLTLLVQMLFRWTDTARFAMSICVPF